MSLLLRIESETAPPRTSRLEPGSHRLGSACADVPLKFPTVSRAHGLLTIASEGITYQDLGSRNGTLLLTGDRELSLAPHVEHLLRPNDRLRIGPFTLSWSKSASAASHAPDPELLRGLARHYAQLLSDDPNHAAEKLRTGLTERAPELGDHARTHLLERIHYEFHGDGPLRSHLRDLRCREIIVNGFEQVYVDLGEGLFRLTETFICRDTYEAWVTRTAHQAGRRLDLQHPICEATLEGGARFHAVMSPVAAQGVSVAIRRFGSAPVSEAQALQTGWISPEALALLKAGVRERRNIVISGGTSAGKTSLLNFLCQYLDPRERVLTVEDTVELAPPIENLVQLQARKPNADGVGEISLRQLVQCALRMRPDRIIVGECRGAEVIEMLQALNTGHPGSLTTVHANSADEALSRLELLALLGATNLSVECIRQWIRSTIDLVVQVERDAEGTRFVREISHREGDRFRTVYERTTQTHKMAHRAIT